MIRVTMKKYILILLVFTTLITNSCYLTSNILSDKKINQQLVTESNDVIITTAIDKYSRSKKWFYGKIEIKNKTDKELKFNFNQELIVDGQIVNADWNIYPISYTPQAFKISPKTSMIWTVVWPINLSEIDKTQIKILPNIIMTEFK